MKRFEKKPLGCGICPYKTNSACHLERHLRIHTGHKPYACSICSYKATDGGLLKRHMRIHSGEKPFTCHICGHKTAQSCSLKDHMAVHTGKKRYSCEQCSFQCSRIGRLRDHKRQHSVGTEENKNYILSKGEKQNLPSIQEAPAAQLSGLVKCPYCSLEFGENVKGALFKKESANESRSQNVKKDTLDEHESKLPFVCRLCSTSVDSIEELNQHVSLHIMYKCINCKSAFETSEQLVAHIRSAELIFKCDFCNFKSRTRNELRGHERTHTNSQPFKCELCDFVSKSGVEFKQHQITHSTNEIVQCNICFAKFAKTGDLREHMTSHCARGKYQTTKNWATELKKNDNASFSSYACFYCQFKCTDKTEMEKHIQNLHVSVKLENDLGNENKLYIDQAAQDKDKLQKLTLENQQSSIDPTSSTYRWTYNDSQMCHFMSLSEHKSAMSDLSYSSESKSLFNNLKEHYSSIPWQLPFNHFLNSGYYNDFKSMNELFRDKDPLFCHFSDALSKFRSNENNNNLAITYEPSSSNGCNERPNDFHQSTTQMVHWGVGEVPEDSDASSKSDIDVRNNENQPQNMRAMIGAIDTADDIIETRAKIDTVKQSKIRTTMLKRFSNSDTTTKEMNNNREHFFKNRRSKRSTSTARDENQNTKKLSTMGCMSEKYWKSPNENECDSENDQEDRDKNEMCSLSTKRPLQVSSIDCSKNGQYSDNHEQMDTGETFLLKLRKFVKDSLANNVSQCFGVESSELSASNKKVHTIELSSDSETSDVDELHICV